MAISIGECSGPGHTAITIILPLVTVVLFRTTSSNVAHGNVHVVAAADVLKSTSQRRHFCLCQRAKSTWGHLRLMPARKRKKGTAPKAKAGPRRPNLKIKRARLDGQFSKFLVIAESEEADQYLHHIVKTLIAEPGKIKACTSAVASDMFLDHHHSELPYDESVGVLQRIPREDMKTWLEEKHPGSVALIKTHWSTDNTLLCEDLLVADRVGK